MNSQSELKLMLVDQSAERRAILEKILRDNGFMNVFSSNGLSSVFELVASIKPDVVLIELESPSRDTLEQVRAIRQRQPTPVVMFAQDQDAQTVHSAVESGVWCVFGRHGRPRIGSTRDRVSNGYVQCLPKIAGQD